MSCERYFFLKIGSTSRPNHLNILFDHVFQKWHFSLLGYMYHRYLQYIAYSYIYWTQNNFVYRMIIKRKLIGWKKKSHEKEAIESRMRTYWKEEGCPWEWDRDKVEEREMCKPLYTCTKRIQWNISKFNKLIEMSVFLI